MRIGVDATSWFNERGYGRYTRELLSAMARVADDHTFVLFTDSRDVERLTDLGANVLVRGVRLAERPVDAAATGSSRGVGDMLRLTGAVRRESPQVLFYPTVYTYFPAPPGVRVVIAVHDTIAERFPELCLPGLRDRLFWRAKVRLALLQSRLVVTVSNFSAAEIAEVLGVDPKRIRVTGEAPSTVFRPVEDAAAIEEAARTAGVPPGARWMTYVGGFNPHKNVETLVEAHARVVQELGDEAPHLVLIGTLDRDRFHGDQAQIRRTIERLGTGDRVHWAGFVPDPDLRLLYAGALASCLPSQCEGFGLPAAEAAACGTPIVATTRSPLPELFEGGGHFVEPRDVQGLADALIRMATDEDERRSMGRLAQEAAERLDWQSSARAAIGALEEACA